MFFTILFVFGCKENAFFSNSRRKYEIPLKLTIAKGIAFREETLQWGLIFSYLYGVIGLYYYRLIYLYRYCVVCLLLYCMLTAWGLYLYFIFVPYFDLYFL